ncbi:MAG TPA: hypothetical protein VMS17_08745 [Gemmataceae bacterium]|nr:hypothetical protein [Gemmataceae bacterium]
MSDDACDALVGRREAAATKADFVEFLRLLLSNHRNRPEEWENATLPDFLEALQGFAEDMEGYYRNAGVEADLSKPGWRVFVDLRLAARV